MVEIPDAKPVPLRRNTVKGFGLIAWDTMDWVGSEMKNKDTHIPNSWKSWARGNAQSRHNHLGMELWDI